MPHWPDRLKDNVTFLLHEDKLRPSRTEVLSAFRDGIAEEVNRVQYQIDCHKGGSYGSPPNAEKVKELEADLTNLQSMLKEYE